MALSSLKSLIWKVLDALDRATLSVAAGSRVMAGLLYGLLNPRFRREQRAVLAGRREYWRSMAGAQRSSPLLRRNIHRLEKGLVMRPRQAVFAADYIEETVEALLQAEQYGALEEGEHRWAIDVLESYFAAVSAAPSVDRARALFGQHASLSAIAGAGIAQPGVARGVAWAPRLRSEGARASVAYADFLALCQQRRSVRWFLAQPVPEDLVLKAIAAAAQAPSACNRQPFAFRYFDRPEDARRIAGIAMGTTGYAQQLQALVVVLGDLSCYPHERDRHVVYIDASLAAMQFMLAIETLGLASCPINWPDVESLERRMEAELRLPAHWRPLMLIAVGYPDPDGGVPYSAKKPTSALLKREDDYAP
jgi:nitroreductase